MVVAFFTLSHQVRSGAHASINTFPDHTVHHLTDDHIDDVVHIHGSFPLQLQLLYSGKCGDYQVNLQKVLTGLHFFRHLRPRHPDLALNPAVVYFQANQLNAIL